MKLFIQGLLASLLVIVSLSGASAQTIYLSYDEAGNRIYRSRNAPGVAREAMEQDSSSVVKDIKLTETLVYPNASDGIYHIQLADPTELVRVQVMDLRGQVIYQEQFQSTTIRLDLTDRPTGLYLLKLTTKEWSTIEKLLKN